MHDATLIRLSQNDDQSEGSHGKGKIEGMEMSKVGKGDGCNKPRRNVSLIRVLTSICSGVISWYWGRLRTWSLSKGGRIFGVVRAGGRGGGVKVRRISPQSRLSRYELTRRGRNC